MATAKSKFHLARRCIRPTPRVSRSVSGNILIFLLLALVGCFMVLPFVYSILQSFKPMNELFLFPPRFYVTSPTWNNYFMLTQQVNSTWVPFTRYLFNSIFVTICATVGQVFFCSMGAFVLSKGRIRNRNFIFSVIVTMLLFTGETTTIPRYLIMSFLGIINTYLAIILPALATPLGLFLMKQFMDGIPNSLLESARMDGASPLRTYWSIVMPIARPVWLTLTIFSFQTIWSQEGLEYIYNESIKMLPTLFRQISAGGIARAGVAAAAAVVMVIPPITVFIVSQSKVIDTMAYSGIK
ncbi:MAG: carbohydrate ABC transporter permease [Oscillospiraceae bacterium]|nr:carbohydrate ABC transporter permease [Oscillospiraceae bacterium]